MNGHCAARSGWGLVDLAGALPPVPYIILKHPEEIANPKRKLLNL